MKFHMKNPLTAEVGFFHGSPQGGAPKQGGPPCSGARRKAKNHLIIPWTNAKEKSLKPSRIQTPLGFQVLLFSRFRVFYPKKKIQLLPRMCGQNFSKHLKSLSSKLTELWKIHKYIGL
jgi:hypothetical protein